MEQKPKVLIATPMYGGSCTGPFMIGVLDLYTKFKELDWKLEFCYMMNESSITRARNHLVNAFLHNDFTHLLFIDADVSVYANDVVDMILMDKPLIGGLYPLKEINWDSVTSAVKSGIKPENLKFYASHYVFGTLPGSDPTLSGNKSLKEVVETGTGYMLIKREVFEALEPLVKSYDTGNKYIFFGKPEPDKTKEFFRFVVDETGRYLSEDYDFCKKWRSLGGKVYVAEWAYAKHIGTYAFG